MRSRAMLEMCMYINSSTPGDSLRCVHGETSWTYNSISRLCKSQQLNLGLKLTHQASRISPMSLLGQNFPPATISPLWCYVV